MRPTSELSRLAEPSRLSALSKPLDGARVIGFGSPFNLTRNGLCCLMHGRPIRDSIAELMDAMFAESLFGSATIG